MDKQAIEEVIEELQEGVDHGKQHGDDYSIANVDVILIIEKLKKAIK